MTLKSLSILAVVFGLLSVSSVSSWAQGSPAEQKLREQVKSMVTQLRTAETDKAALQADKTALEEKVTSGKKAFEELAKQASTEKESAAKERQKLMDELAASKAETAKYMDLHIKADAEGKKAAELAHKTKAELDKCTAEGIRLKDVVAGQRTRNQKMHEIAMEILDRYAKFGLGTALTAREPFVGITRAKLETMVEEYSSAIDAQRIRIGGGTAPAEPSTSTNSKEHPADGKPTGKTAEKKPATKP